MMKAGSRVGKKMKPERVEVLNGLEDDVLYTPSTIADLAVELGVYTTDKERLNFRKNLGQLRIYAIPDPPDGFVDVPGQSPQSAWLGAKWKAAPRYYSLQKRKLSEELAGKIG